MKTARIFRNGRSQAVRLPKECRFKGKVVYVRKFADAVMLFPRRNPWASLLLSLERFSPDFLDSRLQPRQAARKPL